MVDFTQVGWVFAVIVFAALLVGAMVVSLLIW
jgi:hypothetical protein